MKDDDPRDHIEVSPETGLIVNEIAQRIASHDGVALFIDYGHEDAILRLWHEPPGRDWVTGEWRPCEGARDVEAANRACEELAAYGDKAGASFAIETGPERAEVLKAFLDSLVEGVAEEVRGTAVQVTCLSPGPVHSAFAERARLAMAAASLWKLRCVASDIDPP